MKVLPLALVLSALLVLGLLAPVAAVEDTRFPTEAVTVGEQLAGTFGSDVDPELGPIGTAIGADLRAATIAMPDADTVALTIELENLPAIGGTPEVVRYTWDMLVNGKLLQVDGKFSNYSRGACDPTSGQCPPPRDPGPRPFLVRGNCAVADGTNVTICQEIGLVQGDFDTAAKTITLTLPVDLVNAIDGANFGDCGRIAPAAGLFGGVVEAMPSAFFTSGNFPSDTITPFRNSLGGGVFTAPPAADATVDCAGNPIGEDA